MLSIFFKKGYLKLSKRWYLEVFLKKDRNIKPEWKYSSKIEAFEQSITVSWIWEKKYPKEKNHISKTLLGYREMKREETKIMDNIKNW